MQRQNKIQKDCKYCGQEIGSHNDNLCSYAIRKNHRWVEWKENNKEGIEWGADDYWWIPKNGKMYYGIKRRQNNV